ncbi:MAG: hypothetical protein L0Y66_26170 [Myxococcaceae bacterium]|nr:hypothetical protein [Myxococcaceae bacterium]
MPPFGPAFFLTHLGAFVRQQCPDLGEGLPFVHLHLVSGEVLDLCHIIGLTPLFIALAVYEEAVGEDSRIMRTELVPYELFVRVTIHVAEARGPRIGFHQESPPAFRATPEEALQVAATPRVAPETPALPAQGNALVRRGERVPGAEEAGRARALGKRTPSRTR